MAVPKRRCSHSRARTKRAHQAARAPKVVYCGQCGAATLPHHVCGSCGYYQGREVVSKDK